MQLQTLNGIDSEFDSLNGKFFHSNKIERTNIDFHTILLVESW